jgi:hypothetical protein
VLTTGSRVPREVLDLANPLLPTIAPGVAAADSLRSVLGSLEVRRTARLVDEAVAAVGERVDSGSTAVVAADEALLTAVAAGRAAHAVAAACSGRTASRVRSRRCRQRWSRASSPTPS